MIFVILEYHPLNDVIAEPDAVIGWVLPGVAVVLPRIVSRGTE